MIPGAAARGGIGVRFGEASKVVDYTPHLRPRLGATSGLAGRSCTRTPPNTVIRVIRVTRVAVRPRFGVPSGLSDLPAEAVHRLQLIWKRVSDPVRLLGLLGFIKLITSGKAYAKNSPRSPYSPTCASRGTRLLM